MKNIWLVLPCYNEEQVIEQSAAILKDFMERLIEQNVIDAESKVLFVDDGSKDGTWKLLEAVCMSDKLFVALKLANNRGHQNALLAGMMYAKEYCDAVITLDADLQHDISAIPKFVQLYQEGNEIVCGIRKSRKGEGVFKALTGNVYYDVLHFMGVNVIKNHADYRLMSKKALKALEEYKESNLFLRGIIPQLGMCSCTLEYDEKERLAGESKYSLRKILKLAMDGITSFSIRPIQFITGCGFFFFIFSIIMFIYAIIAFCRQGAVPGWTSIVAPIYLLGGIQLLALGIVGEYIGKIYMETKGRPRYCIEKVVGNTDSLRKMENENE